MRCKKLYDVVVEEGVKVKTENPQATQEAIAQKVAERLGCSLPSVSRISRILAHSAFCSQYDLPIGKIPEGASRQVRRMEPEDQEKAVMLIKAQLSKEPEAIISSSKLQDIFLDTGLVEAGEAEVPEEEEEEEPLTDFCDFTLVLSNLTQEEVSALHEAAEKYHITPEEAARLAIREWLTNRDFL